MAGATPITCKTTRSRGASAGVRTVWTATTWTRAPPMRGAAVSRSA